MGKKILIVLVLLASCKAKEIYIDEFCMWYEPITITEKELDDLTAKTLTQIYIVNNEYKAQCLDL